MRLTRLFLAFLIITSPMRSLAQGEGQGGPLIDYGTRFIPAIASRGMVSGPEKLASGSRFGYVKKRR
jgi:hypothetical protein